MTAADGGLWSAPERFGFHAWMVAWLRRNLSEGEAWTESLERLEIVNAGTVDFPASDIERAEELPGGRGRLIVRFLGLSGVASPLPDDFNDDFIRGRETGALIKAFLDVFDCGFYRLHAASMIRRHPALRRALGEVLPSVRAAGTCSRAVLERELIRELGIPVRLSDAEVSKVEFLASHLGRVKLDGSASVGTSARVAGASLRLELGPVPVEEYLERGEEIGRRLRDFLRRQDVPVPWRAELRASGCGGRACIFETARLGIFSWSGRCDAAGPVRHFCGS